MTPAQAIRLISRHGILLESADGPVPSLLALVRPHREKGNWWNQPGAKAFFILTRSVRASADVLVCRLIRGKITFVHRRLWPAIAHECRAIAAARLSQVKETHTSRGFHRVDSIPFERWLDSGIASKGARMSDTAARSKLAPWATLLYPRSSARRTK